MAQVEHIYDLVRWLWPFVFALACFGGIGHYAETLQLYYRLILMENTQWTDEEIEKKKRKKVRKALMKTPLSPFLMFVLGYFVEAARFIVGAFLFIALMTFYWAYYESNVVMEADHTRLGAAISFTSLIFILIYRYQWNWIYFTSYVIPKIWGMIVMSAAIFAALAPAIMISVFSWRDDYFDIQENASRPKRFMGTAIAFYWLNFLVVLITNVAIGIYLLLGFGTYGREEWKQATGYLHYHGRKIQAYYNAKDRKAAAGTESSA